MKKKLFLILTLLFLFFPSTSFAHMVGQPPYFKINGKFSGLYPVPSTSLTDFNLPQDLASENYLVGKELLFTIDTTQLSIIVPQNVIDKTIFKWDFGDGQNGEGLKNTHIYTKMGSYILTIYADTSQIDTNKPQLLQSVLLNVLPSKEYVLPKAVMYINGQTGKDPLVDTLSFPFETSFSFDASKSKTRDTITSYFWDFGDGQTGTKKTIAHVYKKDLRIVFPLLRIKTADGFISDTFLQINNDYFQQGLFKKTPQKKPQTESVKRPSQLPYVILGIGSILVLFLFVKIFRKKR